MNGPNAAPFFGKFTHDGGTVTGTLRNHGTFVYNSGPFAGESINRGTFVMNGSTFATASPAHRVTLATTARAAI